MGSEEHQLSHQLKKHKTFFPALLRNYFYCIFSCLLLYKSLMKILCSFPHSSNTHHRLIFLSFLIIYCFDLIFLFIFSFFGLAYSFIFIFQKKVR